MLPGAALGSLAARFCWQGQHLEALDGARARFGAPCLDAARRSTWEPRASFLLAGAALQALDGARARFGAPCQAQHFRLWTVPERVSGAPPLMLPGAALGGSFLLAEAALQALDGARARFGAPPLDAARRSTWEPRGSFLLAGAALEGFGRCPSAFRAPPLDAARRSTSGSGRGST